MEDTMLVNFYRIVSSEGDEEYIGSTEQTPTMRWYSHTWDYRHGRHLTNSYLLFAKYGVENCRIELIETCEFTTAEERNTKEAELINASLNCVNKCIPGRTKFEYYEAHKDEIDAYRRAYYIAHKDEIDAQHKAYRETHKDEMSAYQRAYHDAHKEERNARAKRNYLANRERILARQKERRQARLLGMATLRPSTA